MTWLALGRNMHGAAMLLTTQSGAPPNVHTAQCPKVHPKLLPDRHEKGHCFEETRPLRAKGFFRPQANLEALEAPV